MVRFTVRQAYLSEMYACIFSSVMAVLVPVLPSIANTCLRHECVSTIRLNGNYPSVGRQYSWGFLSARDAQSSETKTENNPVDLDSDEISLLEPTPPRRTCHKTPGCVAEVVRALGAVPNVVRVRG